MSALDYPIIPNPSGIPVSLISLSKSLTGWPFEKPATVCWECSAPLGPGRFGAYCLCAGCHNAALQAAQQDRF